MIKGCGGFWARVFCPLCLYCPPIVSLLSTKHIYFPPQLLCLEVQWGSWVTPGLYCRPGNPQRGKGESSSAIIRVYAASLPEA